MICIRSKLTRVLLKFEILFFFLHPHPPEFQRRQRTAFDAIRTRKAASSRSGGEVPGGGGFERRRESQASRQNGNYGVAHQNARTEKQELYRTSQSHGRKGLGRAEGIQKIARQIHGKARGSVRILT